MMKVITVYNYHELEELSKLDETIFVYTNSKEIYRRVIKLRGDKVTHIVYDEYVKSEDEVIKDYSEQFNANGITDLQIYKLKERCHYIPYVIIIALLLMVLIIISSFIIHCLK